MAEWKEGGTSMRMSRQSVSLWGPEPDLSVFFYQKRVIIDEVRNSEEGAEIQGSHL